MSVGTKNLKDEDYSTGQSHKADLILKQGFPQSDPQTEFVLVQSSKLSVNARRSARRSTTSSARSKDNPNIKNSRARSIRRTATQSSKDRSTAMVTFDMKGKYDDAHEEDRPIEAAVAKVARASGLLRRRGRRDQLGKALDKMFNDQLKLAGERSIPITIIVLLLVFGALVAVGVPLLLALTGVMATIGSSRCRATSSRWTRTSPQ
jgi:RND superfamily putative drug exporter